MLCECGCGREVNPGRRFIWGHTNKNKPMSEEQKKKISKKLTGTTIPEEVRKKISNSTKGKKRGKRPPFSEEWKHNMSVAAIKRSTDEYRQRYSEMTSGEGNPFYKKEHSNETKKLISNSKRGKKPPPFSDEHKAKMALAKTGENNPNWQGGVAQDPYCCIWKDKGYKEEIKERDNYKCQNPLCKGSCLRLSIHHIDYDKKNCHPRNLITICSSCNVIANKDREWHTAFYKELIRRIYS